MASGFKNFLKGIGLIPNSTTENTTKGDIEYLSSDNKLHVHNGSSNESVVTETSTATLTNKNLSDSTTVIVDNSDPTKQIKLDAAGTTGTATTIVSSQTTNKTITLPDATDTLVGKATTDTLTNKSIDGSTNTLTNIPNAALDNDSITINGATIALGGSDTITANTTNALTIGTGLNGTSFNGSAPVTIEIDSTVATLTGTQSLSNKTFSNTTVFSSLIQADNNLRVQGLIYGDYQSIATTGSNVTLSGITSSKITINSSDLLVSVDTISATGISNGTRLVILNVGTTDVSLTGLDNISTNNPITIGASSAIELLYSTSTWIPLGGTGGSVSTFSATAGENITAGQVVYLNSSGDAFKVDATNDSKIEFAGIALTTVTTGQSVSIQNGGIITLDTSAFTAGLPVYASVSTAGNLQSGAPTTGGQWAIQIGVVLTSSASGTLAINSALSATAIKISGDSDTPAYNTFASPSSVTASGIAAFPVVSNALVRTIFVKGSTANAITTVTDTTPLPIESQPGIVLNIMGTSDADQLAFQNTTNLKLSGTCTLGEYDMLTLVSTGSLWVEKSRNN